MMNYTTLERIVRRAACRTLGAKSESFDSWLVTDDSHEGIELEGFRFGPCVELSFDPSISPFNYFSSDVVFFVDLPAETPKGTSPADVQVFFGNICTDVEAAEAAAEAFLERDVPDGWYVEDCFDCDLGLHLRRELGYEFESVAAFATAVENAFAELCDPEITDGLRSFIHYFED